MRTQECEHFLDRITSESVCTSVDAGDSVTSTTVRVTAVSIQRVVRALLVTSRRLRYTQRRGIIATQAQSIRL